MAVFKYKIVEFAPEAKMEKAFNDLGIEGWELVSVTPVGLKIKGEFSTDFGGLGGGDTEGSFEKIAAYFKKVI